MKKSIKKIIASFILFAVSAGAFSNNIEIFRGKTSITIQNCLEDGYILKYLERYGYKVLQLTYESDESCNRIAVTTNSYKTIVYVEDGIITGHADFPE